MRYNAARRASVGSMFETLILRMSLNSKNKNPSDEKKSETGIPVSDFNKPHLRLNQWLGERRNRIGTVP